MANSIIGPNDAMTARCSKSGVLAFCDKAHALHTCAVRLGAISTDVEATGDFKWGGK